MAPSQANTEALPAIISEREATEGVPSGTSSLSPSISLTFADIDAELLRNNARKRRKMTLTHRLHAKAYRCRSVRLEAQIRLLVQNAAGNLEKAANADAAQYAVLARGGATIGKSIPVGNRSAWSIALRTRRCRRSVRSASDTASRKAESDCAFA